MPAVQNDDVKSRLRGRIVRGGGREHAQGRGKSPSLGKCPAARLGLDGIQMLEGKGDRGISRRTGLEHKMHA